MTAERKFSMNTINDMYINILQHYGFEVTEKKDYKKHLKEIISKNISGVNFVQPRQRRKPENLILEAEVSEAVDLSDSR